LGAVTLGGLVVLLWQGRARWLGVAPILATLLAWSGDGRPQVLVSDSGRLVGMLHDGLRGLSRDRGDGFVAEIWLENDGDRATQAEAAARPVWQSEGSGVRAEAGGWTIWHGAGRTALPDAESACARHALIILSEPAPEGPLAASAASLAATLSGDVPMTLPPGAPCLVFDGPLLAATGAMAIRTLDAGLQVTTSRMEQGRRLWSPGP
jgi:competence protein ComEC